MQFKLELLRARAEPALRAADLRAADPQGTAVPLPDTPEAEILQLPRTRIEPVRSSTVRRTCVRGKYGHASSPHAAVGAFTLLVEALRLQKSSWCLAAEGKVLLEHPMKWRHVYFVPLTKQKTT